MMLTRRTGRPRDIVALLALCLTVVTAGTAVAETITRHEAPTPAAGGPTPYLLYEPAPDAEAPQPSLVIFLYGAHGSIKQYNLQREPYARLRAALARRGYYVVVPELGPMHFMNDRAKARLDGVVDQVLRQRHIPDDRVVAMGTSMGAGSALAYAIHRPGLIRAVCAVMPMTDMARWVAEVPRYAPALAEAYGGTPKQAPEPYDRNSALRHVDAFAHIPVLLLHGNADHTVPVENSVRFDDAMRAKGYACVLHRVDGMGHRDAIVAPFQVEIADFFDASLKHDAS